MCIRAVRGRKLPFTSLRMTINVGKTKAAVFLQNPAVWAARPPFTFTLSPSFPTPLSADFRLKTKSDESLRRHSSTAAQEIVRIPSYSIGVVTAVVGASTAIVEFVDMRKVELRVTDLSHVDLVLDEVDCFPSWAENGGGDKAGINNVNFAHPTDTLTT